MRILSRALVLLVISVIVQGNWMHFTGFLYEADDNVNVYSSCRKCKTSL